MYAIQFFMYMYRHWNLLGTEVFLLSWLVSVLTCTCMYMALYIFIPLLCLNSFTTDILYDMPYIYYTYNHILYHTLYTILYIYR